MQIWNMGNTTARNPLRLREALQLFVASRRTFIATPVVALEIKQILALIKRMKQYPVTVAGIRELLENILSLQRNFESGPSWFEAYSTLYGHWLTRNEN